MDAEQYNTIDFANSKPDSYNATSNDVMSELNAYFKSYIANAEGKKGDVQETLDGILNGSSFDDAIDAIHREHSESNSESDSTPEVDTEPLDAGVEQNVLDVDILDQHIDKHGITGGNDATRAIENMAGGGLNGDAEELDEHDDNDKLHDDNDNDKLHDDFANNMLGMQGGDVRLGKTSAMKGYSGVTNEIRVKGNRVSERNRNSFNYRSEDGRLDMGMLGGSFENEGLDEENFVEEDLNEKVDANEEYEGAPKPIFRTPFPAAKEEEEDASETEHAELGLNRNDDSDYSEEFAADMDNSNEAGTTSMASEIDLVLNQLRNKTARTLTGGTVNIRKKVVLTDMYPYIVRS